MANTQDDLVAQNSGGYADRLAASNIGQVDTADLVQQLVNLEKQSTELQTKKADVEDSSALGRLGSLPGLLTLLAAGGAAAAGGQGGIDVAAGLAGGAIQGARAAKLVDTERLAERIKETQGIIDDQRTRLVTMLQSRPEMFLDPATGKSLVDPRVLGYAATGLLLPIDPGVNYALTKQSQTREAQISTGISLALNGDTPEKRQQGLRIVGNTIGVQFDDSVMGAIEGGDETAMWEAIASSPAFDTRMTVQAWHWALTNNKSLQDPEVISQLMPAATGRPAPDGGKFTLDDKVLEVLGEYTEAIQGVPGVENMSLEQRLDYVFGDDVGKADILKKYFVGSNVFDTGLDGSVIMASITSTAGQLAQLYAMSPRAAAALGINTPGDIPKRAFEITKATIPLIQEGSQATLAQDQGYKMRSIEEKLMMTFPDMDPYDATIQAARWLQRIRNEATVMGYVDNAKFNAGIEALLKQPSLLPEGQ